MELNEQDNLNLIELAYKISLADGSCTSDEYQLLVRLQQELGIDYFPDSQSINDLIKYFSQRDMSVQKTVWLQLYTIIVADNRLDENETIIINKIKSTFSISTEAFDKISQAVDNLNEAYLKLYEAIE